MASNAYKQGYQKGYAGAKAGKGKRYKGMGKGVLSFDFDNYAKEYVKGYRIGMREIN